MDISNVLGALGLVATVIFGFLSVYIVLRRRYPGRITFVQQEALGLVDTIIKNFPQINLHYLKNHYYFNIELQTRNK